MQFESLSDFFAMGGHGLYVWLAYGVTLSILVAYPLSLWGIRRKVQRELTWLNEGSEGDEGSEGNEGDDG